MKHLFFIFLCCLAWVNASANDISFELSSGIEHFSYKEFSDNGSELNHETATLPVVSAAAFWHIHDVELMLAASMQQGTADYQGETQGGANLDTSTDEALRQYQLGLNYRLGESQRRVAVRYAFHHWQRDIQPRGFSSGLSETYRWQLFSLGIMQDIGRWQLSGLLNRSMESRVDIDATACTSAVSVYPRPDHGIQAIIDYRFESVPAVKISADFQQIRMAKSPYQTGSSCVGPIRWSEPDNRLNTYRINFHWRF
ncbi:hypothetical protein [Bacterioplanoides sp. SCSIO 12839]|uniref:hypothetical protein n=1 Tax=Bacterioplanoides sp. SCSIO 12839 TaxID=2829569 RepID=UPI0021085EDD|nr:hypothetical protein [Bacterioplanoides sp. SCSIO 12839]UTW47543.1 hypothetical protein KFF03_13300 [Bacterioplanoides sp. SCSIO 12839]